MSCKCKKISGLRSRARKKLTEVEQATQLSVDMVKGSVLGLTGYGLAEWSGDQLAAYVDLFKDAKWRAGFKAVAAVGTGYLALQSKDYTAEGLLLAGGMGLSATKDVAVMFLPAKWTQYLPIQGGGQAALPANINGFDRLSRQTPAGGGAQPRAMYANGGVLVA